MKNDDRPSAVDRELTRVDGWLRRGLEPGGDTVQRVVRRSLDARPVTGSRTRVTAIGAGLVAIVLAVAIAIFLPRGRLGESTNETVAGDSPVEILTITNVSGAVVVLYPPKHAYGGSADSAHPARPPGQITIFNSNGIVAALVAAPTPHYFMMGGER